MESGGRTARSDLLGGAGWILFGLAVVVAAARMDRFESMGATVYTMPGFVPAIFGAALMLLGAALSMRGWRQRHAERGAHGKPLLNRRVVTMLGLCGVYAAGLIGRAPFWLATVLFVSVFTLIFTDSGKPLARRVTVGVAAGVLTTLAVIVVFEHVFLVRLP
jgi:uncharacterized membrane protein YhaH (DUF805 family)